jgi:hypothetical protein
MVTAKPGHLLGDTRSEMKPIEMEDRMEICNEISVNSKRDWKRGANKIN